MLFHDYTKEEIHQIQATPVTSKALLAMEEYINGAKYQGEPLDEETKDVLRAKARYSIYAYYRQRKDIKVGGKFTIMGTSFQKLVGGGVSIKNRRKDYSLSSRELKLLGEELGAIFSKIQQGRWKKREEALHPKRTKTTAEVMEMLRENSSILK